MSTDPFAGPSAVPSQFASVQSFQGRLVIIEPTKFERNIPSADDPTKLQDRITATISTVDGQGRVQIYSRRVATGQYLEGPSHEGVWISNDRLVKQLLNHETGQPHRMVLGRIDSWKGGPAGKGNPYEIKEATEQDKDMARKFLADRMVGGAAAPSAAPAPAPGNPFGG